MKRISGLLAGACVAAALTAGAGHAADVDYDTVQGLSGLYVRGDLGVSILDWNGGKDDTGFLFGGGLGYRFNDFLRADVRYSHAGKLKVGGGTDLTASSVMGSIYFDLPVRNWPVRPYLGAGLGYGWVTFSPGKDDDGLAAAFMAGVSAELTPNFIMDVGYRFHDIFISGANVTDHQLLVGMRYQF